MKKVLPELAALQDADTLRVAEDAALRPVTPLAIKKDGVSISHFTVIATFGTTQDVTERRALLTSNFYSVREKIVLPVT